MSHDPRGEPQIASLAPDSEQWRSFALAHSRSPLQHPSWLDTITGAYRLRARILALSAPDGRLLAAMPMVRSRLPWRNRWSSLPFTDTLEPVAIERAHRDRLLAAAARQADVEPILVRTRADLPGWYSRLLGTVQLLDISAGTEGVLRGASSHHRRSANRARRAESELSARTLSDRNEFLGANLALMASSRTRLGAPTQPRRYWSRLWELHARGEAVTVGVYHRQRLVANGVFLLGREHAVYKYGAADTGTRSLRTSYLMFVTAFDALAARGMRTLDFGITDLHNEPLRTFKARWGGEEQPAHFSATDVSVLPQTLEPGPLLTKAIQSTPVFVGRTVGSVAYPFVA